MTPELVSWAWVQVQGSSTNSPEVTDGPPITDTDSSDKDATVVAPIQASGTANYYFKVTATDGGGNQGEAVVRVIVIPDTTDPVANAGADQTGAAGTTQPWMAQAPLITPALNMTGTR